MYGAKQPDYKEYRQIGLGQEAVNRRSQGGAGSPTEPRPGSGADVAADAVFFAVQVTLLALGDVAAVDVEIGRAHV